MILTTTEMQRSQSRGAFPVGFPQPNEPALPGLFPAQETLHLRGSSFLSQKFHVHVVLTSPGKCRQKESDVVNRAKMMQEQGTELNNALRMSGRHKLGGFGVDRRFEAETSFFGFRLPLHGHRWLH